MHRTNWWLHGMGSAAAAALVLTLAASPAAQTQSPAISTAQADAIRAHLDEAEDAVEALLELRHVLTSYVTEPTDRTPTHPTSTLIALDRGEVEKLVRFVSALAAMVPAPPNASEVTRGGLHAHAMKAHDIARELMVDAAPKPVGTSGGRDTVRVDRTALERLEIELDAMEELLPRAAN